VLEAVREYLFCPEAIAEAVAAAKEAVKRHAPPAKGKRGKQPQKDRLAQVEREIGNVMAAVRAGGNNGAAALLRGELDRLTAERDQLAEQQAGPGDGAMIEKALERALAAVPKVVEEHLAFGSLAELTDPCRVERARVLLAELVTDITVLPAKEKGCYTCTVTGDISGVLRVAGDKRKSMSGAGSPGGICARLILQPQATFRLQPVHGVRRDRLAETVKSALRIVRSAEIRRYAVAGCFTSG
jgi:hypothetical protein